MKVSELYWITGKLVQEGLGDTRVILASDPEGNDFHELEAYGNARWDADEGELYSNDEDDPTEDPLETVVVLWP